MPLEIRPATLEDAGTISALNADVQQLHADAHPWRFKPSGPDTFTGKDAADLLSKPGYFGFLALDEGAPAGYLVAEVVRRPESPQHFAHDMIYIHHISVRAAARRKSVGTLLLNAAKAHGQSLGISLVALDTWWFNKGALRFFQENGLVPYNVRLWNKAG